MNTQPRALQYATPPESSADAPLTPPPTEEKTTSLVSHIIEVFKRRRRGRYVTRGPWVSYSLDRKGYQELQYRIQQDEDLRGFVEHKLRYDYFASTGRLVHRMPTALHEYFIAGIVDTISDQLKAVQDGSAAFAKQIKAGGSTTIRFADGEYDRHDPDAQYSHLKARYAGIVIEVSYSQKRKDLRQLADEYILGSDGDIQAVVGLDIEYRASKVATLSVWRPNIVRNEAGEDELVAQWVVKNQIFRDSSGNPVMSGTDGLRLRLRDFATEALTGPESQLCDPISVPASTLFSLLKEAEDKLAVDRQQTGVVRTNKPWVRKRHREFSPVEELTERDEKRFREDEIRAELGTLRDDDSYKTSSTSEQETD